MPAGNVVISTLFKMVDYAVTIQPAENGTVIADKQTANMGETVTLTITPNEGYEFDQLIVMNGTTQVAVTITTDGKYTFVMPAGNVAISATYKAIYYDIVIVPPVSGTVTADKQTAHIGETVTLTITPNEGYEFDQLHVLGGETQVAVTRTTEGKYTFVMPAGNVVISTLFKMVDYAVTIQPAENGTVIADKQTANMGETVTLTITPNEGYEFDQLIVMNGTTQVAVTITTEGKYTFVMPAGNVVISTLFKMVDYAVTIQPAENGTVIADKQTANMGETVTLTITPNEGYEFDQLIVMNGTTQVAVTITTEGKYTFVMPAGNVVISALFKETSDTGVHDATATDILPCKVLRDGQVYILRAGKTYTATGIEVK